MTDAKQKPQYAETRWQALKRGVKQQPLACFMALAGGAVLVSEPHGETPGNAPADVAAAVAAEYTEKIKTTKDIAAATVLEYAMATDRRLSERQIADLFEQAREKAPSFYKAEITGNLFGGVGHRAIRDCQETTATDLAANYGANVQTYNEIARCVRSVDTTNFYNEVHGAVFLLAGLLSLSPAARRRKVVVEEPQEKPKKMRLEF